MTRSFKRRIGMESIIVSKKPVIKVKGCPVGHTERTVWCGPYALALLSGLSYDEVYKKALRKIRALKKSYEYKPTSIKGMYPSELTAVAKTLKTPFAFERLDGRKNKRDQLTLTKAMDYLKPNRVYVVMITDHFLVVNTSDWTYCDSVDRGWYSVKSCSYARSKVDRVGEVKRHKLEVSDVK